jgi:hypothetical protein
MCSYTGTEQNFKHTGKTFCTGKPMDQNFGCASTE